MVKFKSFINNYVTLSTNDCISDAENVRLIANRHNHTSLLCRKESIVIGFNCKKNAVKFIKEIGKIKAK